MKQRSMPVQQPEPDASELSRVEQLIEQYRPYGTHILLGVLILFAAFMAGIYLINSRYSRQESEWRSLHANYANYLAVSSSTRGLVGVAEEFPDSKAAMLSLQLAGDIELNSGLDQLSYDRVGGLKLIEKAKQIYTQIIDAPAKSKTTMIQQSSVFSLAYANESLGEFETAKASYQQLIDAAPDSHFGIAAIRGIDRCTDPTYAVLYEKFKSYKDPFEIAPGPATNPVPDISFPGLDDDNESESMTSGGGDFGTEEETDPADSVPESTDETPSDETPSDETEADETPSDETEADETPSDETEADETEADNPSSAPVEDAETDTEDATDVPAADSVETESEDGSDDQ